MDKKDRNRWHTGKVAKFEQQLSGNPSRTVNENIDENFNVFEVEHSNLCHTALVYNHDGDEVDEHGNTQWILSAKKSLTDGEYMINLVKLVFLKLSGWSHWS